MGRFIVEKIWRQLQLCDLNLWEKSSAFISLLSAHISTSEDKLPEKILEKCDDLINKLISYSVKVSQLFY